ncbi:MAG TPA: EVE domain-containing protein [Terrabacter sp.]|nr:EVE domain-containing protein [Terrabacter sp.]
MAKQRAVERGRLGAWLLKCNPALWDLPGLLASGQDRLTSWAVQPGYRARLVAAGDPVLFWVSGGSRQGLQRGIWGLGHATSEVEPWAETEQGRWRSASASHAVRARVEVDVRLLDEPVTDDELRAAGIDALEVQRQPFMANPSFVSRAELDDLRPLLPPWPGPPQGVTVDEGRP